MKHSPRRWKGSCGPAGTALLAAALCAARAALAGGDGEAEAAGRHLARGSEGLAKGTAAEVRGAIAAFTSAVDAYRRIGDPRGEARAWVGQGQARLHLGEAREARDAFGCASSLARAARDDVLEAESDDGLGEASFLLGEPRRALEHFARAEAVWCVRRDAAHLAATWNSVALAYDALGEQRTALAYLEEALPLARAAGNALYEGVVVASMGKLADDLGDWQQALDCYRQGLEAARAGGDARGEAVMLSNLGLTHHDLGDLDEAERYLDEALLLRRKVGDRRGEARTLTALGRTAFDRGRRADAAERYRAALDLSRAAGDPVGESTAFSRQAELLQSSGRNAEAREAHLRALALRQGLGATREQAASLTRIAALDASLGAPERALSRFDAALTLFASLGELAGEVDARLERARVHRDLGRLEDASADVAAALAGVERLRTNVASSRLRATYLAKLRSAYVLDVDVKLLRHRSDPARGFDAEAFEAAERMRARSLLDLIGNGDPAGRIRRDRASGRRARELELMIHAKLERQLRLGPGREPERAALGRELEGLTRELEETEARMRLEDPRFARLARAEPFRLAEIRRLVLDEDTLLLSFVLGDEKSFLFTVGPATLECRELPPRGEIEAVARRLLAAVKARQDGPNGEPAAARRERRRRAEAAFDDASSRLGRMLFGPSTEGLGGRRLAVLPDGILQFVPFAALRGARRVGPPRLLLLDHEIVTLPSASALVFMRRDREARPRAPKSVVVLADPVFDGDDERVPTRPPGLRPRARRPSADLLRSAAEAGYADGRLPRLPFTRREGEAIVRHAAAGDYALALDFEASRETALAPSLASFRHVHFATHGFLNSSHPELSGVVMSLVDAEGRERPGFLSAVDVPRLKLNADLVALSGCETALGREVAGEGLLGLVRAFVYAGAPRVLASLWKVDDAATAELMGALYARLLSPAPRTAAAALRDAQLAMRRGTRWRSPMDWAFVLVGDWR